MVTTESDVSGKGFKVLSADFFSKEINMTGNGMRNGTDSAEICFSDPAVSAIFLQVVLYLKLNSLVKVH